MWRSDDLYVALWQMARPGHRAARRRDARSAPGKRAATCLPACPLMHGTGLFITLSTLAGGGTVVLSTRGRPRRRRSSGARSSATQVQVLTIVGDVFARPLLAALDAEPDRWDLSRLRAITSSGVTWSPEAKRGLLAHLPHVTLLDSLGASEGLMTRTATRGGRRDRAGALHGERPGRASSTDDGDVGRARRRTRSGMVGVGGPIPLGYYKDPEKTAATFRTVDGVRYSIPGDYATVDADGTIRLLGRGSASINTGGEKVYPEEVELALRKHTRPCSTASSSASPTSASARWWSRSSSGEAGTEVDEGELAAWCRDRMSGYKRAEALPRRRLARPLGGRQGRLHAAARARAERTRDRAQTDELHQPP